jgi:GT2 family glycosyltransferase
LPLDADDLLDPSMILVCADVLDADATLHVAFVDRVDFGDVDGRHTAGEFTVEHLRDFNQISYCSLVRRDAWRAVGGYRTNVSGFDDWDFWLALALAGYRGIHIARPLFLHRRRCDSQMWSVLPRYEEIFAKMVLNNAAAYSEADVEAARTMLALGTPFQRARMSKFIFVGRYYRDYPKSTEVP